MSLTLPAVFVACNDEDIVKSTVSNVDDGRRLVGEVVLNTSFPSNPASRLDWVVDEGVVKPVLEPGKDQVGAVQIDSYNASGMPRFQLVNTINTNFNYWLEKTTDDDAYVWKGATPLSEGNYLFYLNYNKDMLGRDCMYDVVDPVQYAQNEDGEFDKYNALKDEFYLGYKFLEAGEGQQMLNEYDIRLTPIHTRVGVKVKYTDGGTVKVKKIAICKADSELKNEAFISEFVTSFVNGGITYAPMYTRVDIKPAKTHDKQGFLDPACYLNDEYQLKKNKDGVTISEETPEDYDALMNTLVYPNEDKENLTYQYELNFPDCEETTLTQGESVSGFILMPTWNFSKSTDMEDVDAIGETANMIIAVYTDKGMFEVPMIADNINLSGVLSNVTVNGDLEPMNAQRVAYYEISFDNAAASNQPKTFTVNNTSGLLEHLKLFSDVKAETTLHLYSASSDVRMDQEVYNFLAQKSNIKLTLESGELTINKGLTLKDGKSPIDLIYLDNKYSDKNIWDLIDITDDKPFTKPAPTITVEGDYSTDGLNYVSNSGSTLGNDIQQLLQKKAPNFGISTYTNTALPLIKVAEGGKLTVTASVASRVENEGELVVKGEEPVGLLSIVNAGKAEINSKFLALHVFNASTGKLDINADSEFALFNNRSFKLNDNCCLDDENAFTWTWGEVTVAKGAEAYLFGLEYRGEDQLWYGNWGIINNNGTIKAGHKGNDYVNEPDEVKYCINHGRIINNGTIYDLYNDGYVDNDGTLYLAKTTQWSYIDVTDSDNIVLPTGDNNDENAVYVYQAAAKATALVLPEHVTTLVVSNEVVIVPSANEKTNATVKQIILKDGANLSGKFSNSNLLVVASDAAATLTDVEFAGKLIVGYDAKVTVAGKASSVTEVVIVKNNDAKEKEAGVLTVNANVTLTYNGTITNNGIVNVLGSAVAGDNGYYSISSNGIWNGNNDPRPSVTYAEFIANLKSEVTAYINNFLKTDVSTITYDGFDSYSGTNWESEIKKAGKEGKIEEAFNDVVAQIRTENVEALINAFEGKASSWMDETLYENKAAAYEKFRTVILEGNLEINASAVVRTAATELTDEQIDNILKDFAPYRYIWEGCKLDEVVSVIMEGQAQWQDILAATAPFNTKTIGGIQDWMKAVAAYEGNSVLGVRAKAVVEKYIGEYKSWDYSDNQIAKIRTLRDSTK